MREYIRHPSNIPLDVRLLDQNVKQHDVLNNVSEGGLSFCSRDPIEVGALIAICIPSMYKKVEVIGRVVWCQRNGRWYDVGVSFADREEAFRTRMVEQICHIERYKDEVRLREKRVLSSEEAATEWITKYAGTFPVLEQND